MIKAILLLLLSVKLQAQEFVPSQFLGMGSKGIAGDGLYTLACNPAGISRVKNFQSALCYQQHFIGTDIQSQALLFAAPIQTVGVFGLFLKNYGIPKVSSTINAGISYSRFFGETIHTSVSFNYHQYSVNTYSSSNTLSADLGFQYLFEHVHLGAFLKNISRSTFSSDVDQFIPQELGLGMNYLLSDEINIVIEASRRSQEKIVYSTGAEYKVHPQFKIRGGASVNPTRYYAGVGLVVKKFVFDLANSIHTQLGSSPQLSIAYAF